jgi:hypothetical protein
MSEDDRVALRAVKLAEPLISRSHPHAQLLFEE